MTVSISPHRTDGAAQTPAEPKKPTRTPRGDASTVRPRRDWRIIALGLILATLASLGATYFVRRAGTPQSTLVLVRAVGAGQVINRSDLGVVKLTGAEQLGTLSPEQSTEVVGRRAAADLPANSLLNRADITAALAPRAGDNLVGVALKPGQMPVSGIAAGDIVRLVVTGSTQPGNAAAKPGDSWDASVRSVGPTDQDGKRVVDLSISSTDATAAAAAAGTGAVALVLVAPVTGPAS